MTAVEDAQDTPSDAEDTQGNAVTTGKADTTGRADTTATPDPAALRAEIETTRAALTTTLTALVAKTDVKARTGEAVRGSVARMKSGAVRARDRVVSAARAFGRRVGNEIRGISGPKRTRPSSHPVRRP